MNKTTTSFLKFLDWGHHQNLIYDDGLDFFSSWAGDIKDAYCAGHFWATTNTRIEFSIKCYNYLEMTDRFIRLRGRE
jgi:hypothetical protein